MPVDTSIYFQGQKPVALEMPLETAAKAQNLRSIGLQNQMNSFKVADVQREQQEKSSLSDILKKNTITDETGKASLNRSAALSDIYKTNPRMAMEYQKQFETDDLEGLKKQGEIAKSLAWSASPENWAQIKAKALELGMKNAEKLPDVFDPQFIERWQMGTLEGEKQLAARVQQQNFEYGKTKDAQDFGLRKEELKSRSLDRQESRAERRYNAGIAAGEKRQALETPYGLANTPDDAKQVKEAHESKKNFDSKIEQMIALREKHGGGAMMNREDVARGKQLSKDALLEYKNMAKLGVLSQSDEAIINAIIPADVLEYNSPLASMQGQDPILNNLKSFKADKDVDFQNRIKTRTRAGVKTAADDSGTTRQSVNPQASSFLKKMSDKDLDKMSPAETAKLYKETFGGQ